MTATFIYQHKKAYKVSSTWKTIVDDIVSGGEQRRNIWSTSKKKWVLEFDKDSTDVDAILTFFDARKGRFEAFYWEWQATHPDTGKNIGGDGNTYLVRFEDDELNMKHLSIGYKHFQITLVEVLT